MRKASVGEELTSQRENGNCIDPFAVARVTGFIFCCFCPILLCRSQRDGQLVIEDPDTVNGTQSRRYSYKEPYSVLEQRHLRVAQRDYGLKICGWKIS